MEPVTLSFNMDIAALQELGVDPTTSEGKAQLKEFLLSYANEGVGASHVNLPEDHEDHKILAALQQEQG